MKWYKKESDKALIINDGLEKIIIFSISKDEESNFAWTGRVCPNEILMLFIFNGYLHFLSSVTLKMKFLCVHDLLSHL